MVTSGIVGDFCCPAKMFCSFKFFLNYIFSLCQVRNYSKMELFQTRDKKHYSSPSCGSVGCSRGPGWLDGSLQSADSELGQDDLV